MFSSLMLAQDTLSATLQWITLCAAIIAACMPIMVAFISGIMSRRQSLYALRSQQLVRAYEEMFERVSAYSVAAVGNVNAMPSYFTVMAKIGIARMHSSPDISKELDAVERLATLVAKAWNEHNQSMRNADIGEQARLHSKLQVLAGRMVGLLRLLSAAVKDQLGPQYTTSRSWWQERKIDFLQLAFKATGRLMRKKMSKEKKQDNAA